ncbi:MAG: FliA/WhiG family RNA polymerase sigma factor [Verrucomicrobia bacterium]|nr:MAG: FliA/WhiG family RNA polymerase sigma factor [Verrucomicrobiota bacterium]
MTSCSVVAKPDGPIARNAQSPPGVLWQAYHQNKDLDSENMLVRQYTPLVRSIVAQLGMSLPNHVPAEDLFSPGLLGLLQAIRAFDNNAGASFETFACYRIRGAILDELRKLDWVPRSVHDKSRKVQNALSNLEQKFGHSPSDEQMAGTLGLSLAEYRRWLEEIRPVTYVCLDAPLQEVAEGTDQHGNIPDDSQQNPAESTSRKDLAALIARRIRQLPQVQQKVLALYYFEDLRLREIAAALGVTESRICQIHSQAILAIRAFVEEQERELLQSLT